MQRKNYVLFFWFFSFGQVPSFWLRQEFIYYLIYFDMTNEEKALELEKKYNNFTYQACIAMAQWKDEQHLKDNLDINYPKYDNIVDKVFGAGNLECWEYDQAKQLVKLAKDELLLELKAQEKQQLIDKVCEWIREHNGDYISIVPNDHLTNNFYDDLRKAMKGE